MRLSIDPNPPVSFVENFEEREPRFPKKILGKILRKT